MELTTEKIDDDLQVLVVLHPAGISEKTQFALDQFVLREVDRLPRPDVRGGQPQQPDGRHAEHAAARGPGRLDPRQTGKGLGLEFDVNKVLADKEYVTQLRRDRTGVPARKPPGSR